MVTASDLIKVTVKRDTETLTIWPIIGCEYNAVLDSPSTKTHNYISPKLIHKREGRKSFLSLDKILPMEQLFDYIYIWDPALIFQENWDKVEVPKVTNKYPVTVATFHLARTNTYYRRKHTTIFPGHPYYDPYSRIMYDHDTNSAQVQNAFLAFLKKTRDIEETEEVFSKMYDTHAILMVRYDIAIQQPPGTTIMSVVGWKGGKKGTTLWV